MILCIECSRYGFRIFAYLLSLHYQLVSYDKTDHHREL